MTQARRREDGGPVQWSLWQLWLGITFVAAALGLGRMAAPLARRLMLEPGVMFVWVAGNLALAYVLMMSLDDAQARRGRLGRAASAMLLVPVLEVTFFAAALGARAIPAAIMGLAMAWLLPAFVYFTKVQPREQRLVAELIHPGASPMSSPSSSPTSNPTIAIVGASADRSKFGNKAVRAFVKRGWDVYPVNPKGGEIEGLKVYPSLDEVPVALNRISVYLPPERTLKMLDEISVKMCDELWLNPGSESPEVLHKAGELGLEPITACSIVDIGENPSAMSDH